MDHRFSSWHVAFVLFIVASILFGSSFIAIKIGLEYFPPLLLAAFRFEIAGAILLSYVARTRELWPETRASVHGILISSGLVIGLQNVFFNIGIQFTTGTFAAILYSSLPIITTIVAVLLLSNEELHRSDVLGMGTGFIGVFLVINPSSSAFVDTTIAGSMFIIGATTAIAAGSVLLRRISPAMSPLTISGWGMAIGGLAIHVTSILSGEAVNAVDWTPVALITLFYVSVLVTGVGYTAYFHLIGMIGPTKSNLVAYTAPVTATITELLLLEYTGSLTTFAGFSIILIGFLILKHELVVSGLKRI